MAPPPKCAELCYSEVMQGKKKNVTILVVDDDRDIRETLAVVLEIEGYETLCAENGQAALDLLEKTEPLPSLILLDLMMPVMDAWQFRARQKESPRLRDLPVVIISAGGNVEQKAQNLEAAGWLRKPLTIEQLLRAVGAVISKARG